MDTSRDKTRGTGYLRFSESSVPVRVRDGNEMSDNGFPVQGPSYLVER